MKLSWFKSKPKAKELSREELVMREQMLNAVSDELLSQIRGGFEEGCHPIPPN